MANENDSDEGRAVMPDYRGCVFAGSKDGKSYGFYLPDTVVDEAGNISLTDYVVLTGDEHMALMDGQGDGKRIVFHKGEKPTLEEPLPPTEEELAEQIRRKRDGMIDEVEWRIQRYQQQTALGISTNDSEGVYEEILAYVQELRDITKQPGFPNEVVFPELAV